MLENIEFFRTKREKNHRIINIESGGRGELASCPNFFVWDCNSIIFYGETIFFMRNSVSLNWRNELNKEISLMLSCLSCEPTLIAAIFIFLFFFPFGSRVSIYFLFFIFYIYWELIPVYFLFKIIIRCSVMLRNDWQRARSERSLCSRSAHGPIAD